MKERIIENLNRYRKDKSVWDELVCSPAYDEDDNYSDTNALNRTKLSVGLLLDFQASDEELIKFTFEEEIEDRAQDPFQGGSDTLTNLGAVLAQFKNPENVWLFVKAKRANFDTHCGFSYQHILSAGIDATYEIVEREDHELKESFEGYFGTRAECPLTQSQIDSWHKGIYESFFPQGEKSEDLEYWINLAIEFDDDVAAAELIEQLEQSTTDRTADFLTRLQYHYDSVGNVKKEIAVVLELIPLLESIDKQRGKHSQLCALYRKDGQFKKAWQSLQKARKLGPELDKFQLDYYYEAALAVIMAQPEVDELSREIYAFAMENPPSNDSQDANEKRMNAAIKMKHAAHIEHYTAIYSKKKKENEAFMERMMNIGSEADED